MTIHPGAEHYHLWIQDPEIPDFRCAICGALYLEGDMPPIHWACPDCGQPCRCSHPSARHSRCGQVQLSSSIEAFY